MAEIAVSCLVNTIMSTEIDLAFVVNTGVKTLLTFL